MAKRKSQPKKTKKQVVPKVCKYCEGDNFTNSDFCCEGCESNCQTDQKKDNVPFATDMNGTMTEEASEESNPTSGGVPLVNDGKIETVIVEVEQRPDPTVVSLNVSTVDSSPHSSVVQNVTEGRSTSNLASKIASARQGRQQGTPVAGMIPNAEQESILEIAPQPGLKTLVVCAGAGTGKTATLKMLEQVIPGNGQYTAFNASIVNDSKTKFKKAACNTTHSLAFRAVGRKYAHRLNGERMKSYQIAQRLGITEQYIVIEGEFKDDGSPKMKRLSADFLAGQVLVALRRFCQTADRCIEPKHFRFIDGIDAPKCYDNNNRLREYLLPFAQMWWNDILDEQGKLPFCHDDYVKIWQLGTGGNRPIIPADYILLDEAQDTAEVFLDIIRQQTHALVILVGDDCQQIYAWRGAVNALSFFKGAPRRLLSQSYRFGKCIADVANTILATLDEPTDLVMKGLDSIPSRVARVENPKCFLYRTNAGAVGRVMLAIKEGKRPHLIGDGAEVVAWCNAAIELQAVPCKGTRHPELCCFDNWNEVCEYSKTDEGADMRLMVKLINQFGAEEIRDALKNMPDEDKADLVVSTAHKSKGREWDTVRLGPDFPTKNKMTDPDRRLLYVACTRAKLTLDLTECPPFCGGQDYGDVGNPEDDGWVPGLEIEYTCDMPTQEEQDEWIVAQKEKEQTCDRCGGTVGKHISTCTNNPTPTQPVPTVQEANAAGIFTWTKFDGGWFVRGPKTALGSKVRVQKKDGTSSEVTLKFVKREMPDVTIYGI